MDSDKATVFVVDDDPDVLRSIEQIVVRGGMNARTYSSGLEFVGRCPDDACGCLVLDLRMPDLDGLATLEQLAAKGIVLPTVVVTGAGSIRDCARAFKQGVADFLEKPIDEEELLDCIRRALEHPAGAASAATPEFPGRPGEEFLYRMLARMRVGVVLIDGHGRYVCANPAFCRLLGYSIEELLAKTVADVTPPEDFARELRILGSGSDCQRLEKHYIRKDGSLVLARATASLVRNSCGGVDYALAIVENITGYQDRDRTIEELPGRLGEQLARTGKLPNRRSEGSATPPKRPNLTRREQEILDLLVAGKSIKEIAGRFGVSVQAVWKHQQSILKKFAVQNEVELVRVLLMADSNSLDGHKPA